MHRVKRVLSIALSTALVGGCSGYAPSPLDDGRTDSALSAPNRQELSRDAIQLRHPRIAPITLDFSKPLTSDELAVIAVLVNPDLKAMRAKAGVADAQVFDAGLLPDPQLTVGLDWPASGQAGLDYYPHGPLRDLCIKCSESRVFIGCKIPSSGTNQFE